MANDKERKLLQLQGHCKERMARLTEAGSDVHQIELTLTNLLNAPINA